MGDRRLWVLAATLLTGLACSGQGDPGDPGDTAGRGGDSGLPPGTLSVPAGAEAKRYGVETWQVSWDESGGRFSVGLRAPGGEALGTLVVEGDTLGRTVGTHSDPTGAIVTVTVWGERQDDEYWFRTLLEGAGSALLVTTVTDADAQDTGAAGEAWVREVSVETSLPTGQGGSSFGWVAMGSTGSSTAGINTLAVDGSTPSPAEVALWMHQTGLDDLVKNPGTLRALAAFRDGALILGMEQVLEQANTPETSRGALAVARFADSLACDLVELQISLKKGKEKQCCDLCAQVDPEDSFILGEVVAVALGMTCQCCATATGVDLDGMIDCVREWNEKILTDAECQELYGEPPSGGGLTFTASVDGTSCRKTCLDSVCQSYCEDLSLGAFDAIGHCTAQGECACEMDPLWLCMKYYPEWEVCGFVQVKGANKTKTTCELARCGDGYLVSECALHPDLSEGCEEWLSDICGPDLRCDDECKECIACPEGCDTCECAPGDASACGPDRTCTSDCTCETPCWNDGLDLFTAGGKWCDPTAAAAWCGAGGQCDPDTCRCSKCGDGVVEGSEECEEGFAGGACPGDQPCNDCKCANPCGNGVKDPGEQCDPPGSGACPMDFECSEDCDCVEIGDNPCTGDGCTTCGEGCELCQREDGHHESHYVCEDTGTYGTEGDGETCEHSDKRFCCGATSCAHDWNCLCCKSFPEGVVYDVCDSNIQNQEFPCWENVSTGAEGRLSECDVDDPPCGLGCERCGEGDFYVCEVVHPQGGGSYTDYACFSKPDGNICCGDKFCTPGGVCGTCPAGATKCFWEGAEPECCGNMVCLNQKICCCEDPENPLSDHYCGDEGSCGIGYSECTFLATTED